MSAKLRVRKDRKCVIAANFVDGRVNSHYDDQKFDCRLLGKPQSQSLKDAKNKILVAETPEATYVGKSFGPQNLDHSASQYEACFVYRTYNDILFVAECMYAGVYDPVTGEMQVCDMEQFFMHSSFKEKANAADMMDGQDQEILGKNYSGKIDLLLSSFGSSKRKRAMESRHRNAVSEDVLKGVLDSTIDHGLEQAKSHKQRRSEVATEESETTTPPCNKDATNVHDVYNISDIVSEEDLNVLAHDAQVFVNCTSELVKSWRDSKEYPVFVLNRLHSLPLKEDKRLRMCSLLMYLSQMIYLYKLKGTTIDKKDAVPKSWSLAIKHKLFDTFTMKVQLGRTNKRCVPSRLRDKLCSYILTICLILEEFSLSFQDIQNDLGINKIKMMQHVKALGCTVKPVSSGSEELKALLKLPLQFQTSLGKRKER